MATWSAENITASGVAEVDFVFSDSADFVFSDSSDFVFREAVTGTSWSGDSRNTATLTAETKN